MHSAIHIAKHLVERANTRGIPGMTPMKLLKLCYIAHGWMLGLYSRPLISEDVEAWQYGPVIPELYREIKMYKDQPVMAIPVPSDARLDDLESNLLDQILTKYGQFSGFKLSSMTHTKGTPWYNVWHQCQYDVIPNALIAEYYKGLAARGHRD